MDRLAEAKKRQRCERMKKYITLLGVIFMTISFIGCNNSSISDRGYQQISMNDAIEMMKEEQDYKAHSKRN